MICIETVGFCSERGEEPVQRQQVRGGADSDHGAYGLLDEGKRRLLRSERADVRRACQPLAEREEGLDAVELHGQCGLHAGRGACALNVAEHVGRILT